MGLSEEALLERESLLREWFTRGKDPLLKAVDGLDVGWGGVQRWATGRMPLRTNGIHLDFACGCATFLAQLGWRYPSLRLVGLNIDFEGPHSLARPLLNEAGVRAVLVRADARKMAFPDQVFDSVSCFLGLQDIEIGFGERGIRETIQEAARVLRVDGRLFLLDEFPPVRFEAMISDLPLRIVDQAERPLDVRWERQVSERAIQLYAAGWAAQAREEDAGEESKVREQAYQRYRAELEAQLAAQGFYVPFGPVRLFVTQKVAA